MAAVPLSTESMDRPNAGVVVDLLRLTGPRSEGSGESFMNRPNSHP